MHASRSLRPLKPMVFSHRFFRFFCLAVPLILIAGRPGALAQSCAVDRQAVFYLRQPVQGDFSVWDGAYAAGQADQGFLDVLPMAQSHYFAVGRSSAMPGQQSYFLGILDARGRMIKRSELNVSGLASLVKILPRDRGYVLLGQIRREDSASGHAQIWLGFLDEAGVLQNQVRLEEDKSDAAPADMLAAQNGGFILAARLAPDKAAPYSQIYVLSKEGNVLIKRSYRPGPGNRIARLAYVQENKILAAGSMAREDGNNAGWAMMMNQSGQILWDRVYGEGLDGTLAAGAALPSGDILLAGDMREEGRKPRSGWVLSIDAQGGDILWDRRLRGRDDLKAAALIADQTQASVIYNAASAQGDAGADYARVVSLNAQGVKIGDETYQSGSGARVAHAFLKSNGERVMAGETDRTARVAVAGPPAPGKTALPDMSLQSKEGWIMAAQKLPTDKAGLCNAAALAESMRP